MTEDTEDARCIANEVTSFIGDACGDLGFDAANTYKNHGWWPNDEASTFFKKLIKEHGDDVDLGGCYADHLYNDVDTLQDFMGDRIYDECGGDRKKMNKVLEVIAKARSTHTAMAKAAENLMKD